MKTLKVVRYILAAFYVLLFALPGIVMLTGLSSFNVAKFERRELRPPHELPTLASSANAGGGIVEAIAAWPGKFELWFNDHYGFRRGLISGNSAINHLLHIYPGGNIDAEVVVGQNDRLFLGDVRQKIMSQHTGEGFVLSDTILVPLINKFEERAQWLAERGIVFVNVIAPDKHSIYPEDLPLWLTPTARETSADKVCRAARDKEIAFVDVRSILKAGKSRHMSRLYYMTDSHWSDLGAFIAYQEIMKTLAERDSSLKMLSLKEYTVDENKKGYDLARLGNISPVNDFSLHLIFNEGDHPVEAKTFRGDIYEMIDGKTVGTGDNVIVTNENAPNPKTVLMLRDSFALALVPLFNQTFTKMIYTARTDVDNYKALVEEHKPDIVIYEVAERFLPYL